MYHVGCSTGGNSSGILIHDECSKLSTNCEEHSVSQYGQINPALDTPLVIPH